MEFWLGALSKLVALTKAVASLPSSGANSTLSSVIGVSGYDLLVAFLRLMAKATKVAPTTKTKSCSLRRASRFAPALLLLLVTPVKADNGPWDLSIRFNKAENIQQAPTIWQGDAITFYVVAMVPPSSGVKLVLPETNDFQLTSDRAVLFNSDQGQGLAFPVNMLPIRAGSHQLPPFTLTDGQQSQQTQALTLQVRAPESTERMSLATELSQKEIYLGQSVRLTTRWTFDYPVESLKAVHLLQPELTHFAIKAYAPWDQISTDSHQSIGLPVSGQRLIASWRNLENKKVEIEFTRIIHPNQAGRFKFPAATLLVNIDKNSLEQRGRRYRGSTMPSYFNNSFFEKLSDPERYVRFRVTGQPTHLRVKALPAPQPDNFSGIVGQPFITASATPGQLLEDQPLQYSLELQHPDIESIQLPSVAAMNEFQQSFEIPSNPAPAQLEGNVKRFHQSLFPKSAEVKEVPAYKLSYFEPTTKSYETISLKAIAIEVKARETFEFSDAKLSEKVKLSNKVKPYHKGVWGHKWGDELTQPSEVKEFNPLWLLLLLVPPLAFGLMLLKPWLAVLAMKKQGRPFVTFKQSVLADGEGVRHFTRYCQERLKLPPSQCTPSLLKQKLSKVDQPLALQISSWLAEVERGYGDSTAEKARLTPKATRSILDLLEALEKKLDTPVKPARTNSKAVLGVMLALVVIPSLGWNAKAEDHEAQLEALYQEHQVALELAEGNGPKASRAHEAIAQQLTELLAESELNQASLMYNIGTSWYHAGRYGHAILWLQRAAALSPDDAEIWTNLAQARAERLDALPEYFAPPWYGLLYQVLSSSLWAWFTLVVYLWLCFMGYKWCRAKLLGASKARQAKSLTSVKLSSTVLFVLVLGLVMAHLFPPQQADGVITARKVETKKGPNDIFAAATTTDLNQGTEFVLLLERGDWVKVKLSNEQIAWLPAESVALFH